jgi:hypothetical protein
MVVIISRAPPLVVAKRAASSIAMVDAVSATPRPQKEQYAESVERRKLFIAELADMAGSCREKCG